ncbi:MAG: YraN family protein [Nitrosarchaeum sp.]|nr:YraN family protein [Nitrosarchaeum sp.]
MSRINKHDLYVAELVSRIESQYDEIQTHLPLFSYKRNKRRVAGEIDLLARKGDALHVYEVKCSYRPIKARKQLMRIRRLIGVDDVRLFFFNGESGSITALLGE